MRIIFHGRYNYFKGFSCLSLRKNSSSPTICGQPYWEFNLENWAYASALPWPIWIQKLLPDSQLYRSSISLQFVHIVLNFAYIGWKRNNLGYFLSIFNYQAISTTKSFFITETARKREISVISMWINDFSP